MPLPLFQTDCEDAGRAPGCMGLAACLGAVGGFLRGFRARLRFGELTRAPLTLLRLQVMENCVECDWLARPADPWDADLRGNAGERHAARQALEDAIAVRALIFQMLPGMDCAALRIFRDGACGRELVAVGRVERRDRVPARIGSLAMRAKLLGFQFAFEEETLIRMAPEVEAAEGVWSSAA